MKKSNWKSKLFLLTILSLVILCFFAFTSCNDNDNGKKGAPVVPTYQGMTISKLSDTSKLSVQTSNTGVSYLSAKSNSSAGLVLLSSTDASGDSVDTHEGHEEKLESEIEVIINIDVETDDEIKYYVQPNETFIIEVHISNPYDYEIQSFTLNGKKYANYMFKEGSTMELLLLEVTAPATSGYMEYSIDAIKYIDGTEIKDVDMSSGEKSIKAGVAYTEAPSAKITDKNLSTTSISLDIMISDPDSLIGTNELAIYLSDGEKEIAKKSLQVGSNSISFGNLEMSKTYEYGVVAVFDRVDGRDTHAEWLLTEKVTTLGAYTITNIVPTKDTIVFDVVRTGEVGTIDSISLYDATTNKLIQKVDASVRSFSELLSGHTYNLYVDFSYSIHGETITDWASANKITTVAKVTPTVSFESATSDKTSVSYSVKTSDTDDILNITKVEILKGTESVKDNGVAMTGSFTELLSNTKYMVKVSYTYDLNDGQGAIADSVSKEIATVAKVKPIVSISELTAKDTTVSANLSMDDQDRIGTVTSVQVFQNDSLVATNAEKKISFDNLSYYTDYKVAVSYAYDLNDGAGIQTDTITQDFKTAPHLVFNTCKIINTSAVSEGETIYMQVSLDNPSGALPGSVIVNGQAYNCTGSTTPTKIYVEIVNNGQFEGGNTALTIEQVNMKLDGVTYSVNPTTNNSGSVFINGALTVESISLVNSLNEVVDYCMPGDSMKLLLTLHNKTGYTIDNTSLGEWTKIDDEHFYKNVTLSNGWNSYSLTSISYHNSSLSKTLSLGGCSSNKVYKVNSSTIVEIKTVNDLMNTTYNGGYYKLMSDIDLSGVEWTSLNSFNGVLDGNGYKIKNMSNVSTIQDKNINIGLFYRATGLLKNVELIDVTVMVTLNSSNDDSYSAYFGGVIFGNSGSMNTKFINCHVEGDISINNTTGGSTIAGGMIGYEYPYPGWLFIDNCSTNVSISLKNGAQKTGSAGGIVGQYAWAALQMYVFNCAIEGSIDAANAQIINGSSPRANCTVEYKNNTCDIYLNGKKVTEVQDYYFYDD